MSAWDYEGRYTREEDDGTESDPSRSVLERWHVLNLMHAPGMTDGFYRILGIIAESCPPGNELWKGRKRLAEDAGQSLSNVKKFYSWAYSQGIMERQEGRRGFSDRVTVSYANMGISEDFYIEGHKLTVSEGWTLVTRELLLQGI